MGAPANQIRGVMGHQFRSGVSSEDTLPFYIAPTFRAFDFVNLDGEDIELLVGVTALARMTALHLPLSRVSNRIRRAVCVSRA